MLGLRDFGRAPCADHQEPRRLRRPRERDQEIQCGLVAPVQIFEDQNKRSLRGQCRDRLAHLAEHPLSCRTSDPLLQDTEIPDLEEPGNLDEPGRCLAGEQFDEATAAGLAAKPSESRQHGQIRLAGAVLLDALTGADPERALVSRLFGKRLHERALADTGFTGHEDKLSAALPHRLQQVPKACKLGRAADHEIRTAYRPFGPGGVRGTVGTLHEDVADQAIPAAMYRLDVSRSSGVVVQRLAELPDTDHQSPVGHGGPGPRGIEQDFLRDEAAWMLSEAAEDGERLWPERNRPRASHQALVLHIEPREVNRRRR